MSATTLAVDIWKKRFDKALSRVEHAQTALYRDPRKKETIALNLSPRRLATVHRIAAEVEQAVNQLRTDGDNSRADELDELVAAPCHRIIRAGGKASITIERGLAIIAFIVRQYAAPLEGAEPLNDDDERKDRAEFVSKLDKSIASVLDPSQKDDDQENASVESSSALGGADPTDPPRPSYLDDLSDGYELGDEDDFTPAPQDHGRNLNPGRNVDAISDEDTYELDD